MKYGITILMLLMVVIGCENEGPYDQPEAIIQTYPLTGNVGPIQSSSVNLESDYKFQKYFSLPENEVLFENLKTEWDFMFQWENDNVYWHLNGAQYMFTYFSDNTDVNVEDFTSTSNLEGHIDDPNLGLNGLQIGKCNDRVNGIFAIDLGLDVNDEANGTYKFKLLSVDSDQVVFQMAALEATSFEQEITVQKDEILNKTFFDVQSSTTVEIEQNITWDLLFTQYTDSVPQFGVILPYRIVGVVANEDVEVAQLNTPWLNEFDETVITNLVFSSNAVAIGWDWKVTNENFDFSIVQNRLYVVRIEEAYYQLKFLDFYGATGEKGDIQFQFQRIL